MKRKGFMTTILGLLAAPFAANGVPSVPHCPEPPQRDDHGFDSLGDWCEAVRSAPEHDDKELPMFCCHCDRKAVIYARPAFQQEPKPDDLIMCFKPGHVRGLCENHADVIGYHSTVFLPEYDYSRLTNLEMHNGYGGNDHIAWLADDGDRRMAVFSGSDGGWHRVEWTGKRFVKQETGND